MVVCIGVEHSCMLSRPAGETVHIGLTETPETRKRTAAAREIRSSPTLCVSTNGNAVGLSMVAVACNAIRAVGRSSGIGRSGIADLYDMRRVKQTEWIRPSFIRGGTDPRTCWRDKMAEQEAAGQFATMGARPNDLGRAPVLYSSLRPS
jgi:hypothetical protein